MKLFSKMQQPYPNNAAENGGNFPRFLGNQTDQTIKDYPKTIKKKGKFNKSDSRVTSTMTIIQLNEAVIVNYLQTRRFENSTFKRVQGSKGAHSLIGLIWAYICSKRETDPIELKE